MEVGVKSAWMTGAKLKNKAHLQALPTRFSNVLVTPLMKHQARNVWRGTYTTRRYYCSVFFVKHSLT